MHIPSLQRPGATIISPGAFGKVRRSVAACMLAAYALTGVVSPNAFATLNPFSVPDASAATGINRIVNYQGKISEIGGATVADDSYNMQFKIYDALTGGNVLWSENWTNSTTRVTMTGGLFSVGLGTHITMTGSVNFNTDNLYLQIGFDPGNDGTFEETFSPRRRFGSVPYAHNADTVDGLDSTKFLRRDQVAQQTFSGSILFSTGGTAITVRGAISGAMIHASSNLSTSGSLTVRGATALHSTLNVSGLSTFLAKVSGTNAHFTGTVTGSIVKAATTLASSGALTWEGAASGATLWVSSFEGAGLTDCDLSTQTLAWDATLKRFGCGTDSDTTYAAGQGLTLAGNVFTLNTTITGALLEFTTVSGATVRAQNMLASSGALTWEGAASGASLWVSSFEGAGLTDCDADNQTLAWDATLKRFTCGDDDTGGGASAPEVGTEAFSGAVKIISDPRFVNIGGDTMTGALVIDVRDGVQNTLGLRIVNTASGAHLHAEKTLSSSGTLVWEGAASGASLWVSSFEGAGLTDCDVATQTLAWDATLKRFGCGTDSDTTYSFGQGLTTNGTTISLSTTVTGALLEFTTVSGATVHAQNALRSSGSLVVEGATVLNSTLNVTGLSIFGAKITGTNAFFTGTVTGSVVQASTTLASSGTLVWEGAASGATLWISSLDGAGLTDCDAATQTLSWDATGKRFGCGTDSDTTYGFGQGLTTNGTTISLSTTITGALLEFTTVSGATVRAQNMLASSGALTWEGAASGASLWVSSFEGAGLTDCDLSTQTLAWDATLKRFGCGTDSDTTYGFGQGLTTNGTTISLSTTVTGALLEFGTVSGATVRAQNMLASSGALTWEGAASGASLWVSSLDGAGLTDCDADNQTLAWDATLKRFTCGDDDTGGASTPEVGTEAFSGAVKIISDPRFVNIGGDTMSGALIIDVRNGVQNTLGLRIVNTASGAHLHAEKTLSSSGTLVTEGATVLNSTLNVSGLSIFSSKIIGTNAYFTGTLTGSVVQGVTTLASSGTLVAEGATTLNSTLNVTGLSVFGAKISGTSAHFTGTVTGAIVKAATTLASSGTLVWEGIGSGQSLNLAGGNITISRSGTTIFNILNKSVDFVVKGTAQNLIYADASVDRLGIGTTSPGSRLSVSGAMIIGTSIGSSAADTGLTLEVLGTMSGRMLRAMTSLNSSGSLTWEGTASGNTLAVSRVASSLLPSADDTWDLGSTALRWQDLYLSGGTLHMGSSTLEAAIGYLTTGFEGLTFNVDTDATFEMYMSSGGLLGIGTSTPKTALEVIGTMSGSKIVASSGIASSGSMVLESMSKTGLAAMTIIGAGSQTGVYINADDVPALAINSNNNDAGAPAIIFGYRGSFDTRITRTHSGSLLFSSQTGVLITLDSEMSVSKQDVFRIITDYSTDENKVFRITASGSVFADSAYHSSGADYAEWFFAGNENLKPGETVCIDVSRENAVKRCDRDADSNVMGIVSTNPAFVGNVLSGADGIIPPGYALIGLIGQVPAKVTVESGAAIRPGDSLTAASTPGYARKANAGESTVGVALEGLSSGEGVVNVLISRRNQSLTVESVEDKVLATIASMEIEDEVELMVSAAMGDLNVDEQISTEVERQIAGLSVNGADIEALRIEIDLLKARLAAILPGEGSTTILSNTGSFSSVESLEVNGTLATGGDARIGGDLFIDGALNASALFVPGGLTIDGGVTMNGMLDAANLRVSSEAIIDGTLTIAGEVRFASGAVFSFGEGAAVNIADLTVQNALFVMGDVTIAGLATFLGDIDIKGELIVSDKQAGFAMIPQTGTSVTVRFGTGFRAVPVVTATPDFPVAFAVNETSSGGFTIYIASPAPTDILFSWHALGVAGSVTIRAQLTDDGAPVFPVDTKNIPVSSNAVWNACIRNVTMLDESGQPLSCGRYHDQYTWSHPDLGISFIWNTSTTPPLLIVPDEYVISITEEASNVESAFDMSDEHEHDEEPSTDTGAVVSSSSSESSSSSSSSASSVASETPIVEESEEPIETSSSSSSASSEASSVSSVAPIEEPVEEPIVEETGGEM